MNNSKDIVPFWNKARQAMQDISSLLEEAEKETLKKLKDQIGSLTLTLPTRKGTGMQVSPCGGGVIGSATSPVEVIGSATWLVQELQVFSACSEGVERSEGWGEAGIFLHSLGCGHQLRHTRTEDRFVFLLPCGMYRKNFEIGTLERQIGKVPH